MAEKAGPLLDKNLEGWRAAQVLRSVPSPVMPEGITGDGTLRRTQHNVFGGELIEPGVQHERDVARMCN